MTALRFVAATANPSNLQPMPSSRWLWVGSAAALAAGVAVKLLPSAAPASSDLYAILGASPSASDADLKKWVPAQAGASNMTPQTRVAAAMSAAQFANCAAQEYAGNTARGDRRSRSMTDALCARAGCIDGSR